MRLKAAVGAALALLVASCSGGGADTKATDTTGIDGARIIKASGEE